MLFCIICSDLLLIVHSWKIDHILQHLCHRLKSSHVEPVDVWRRSVRYRHCPHWRREHRAEESRSKHTPLIYAVDNWESNGGNIWACMPWWNCLTMPLNVSGLHHVVVFSRGNRGLSYLSNRHSWCRHRLSAPDIFWGIIELQIKLWCQLTLSLPSLKLFWLSGPCSKSRNRRLRR